MGSAKEYRLMDCSGHILSGLGLVLIPRPVCELCFERTRKSRGSRATFYFLDRFPHFGQLSSFKAERSLMRCQASFFYCCFG